MITEKQLIEHIFDIKVKYSDEGIADPYVEGYLNALMLVLDRDLTKMEFNKLLELQGADYRAG